MHPEIISLHSKPQSGNRISLVQRQPSRPASNWSLFTEQAARRYGVDRKLIEAIIIVESGGNPSRVSRSNAVGLMQIKASTAGREVYRFRGKRGRPDRKTLRDPAHNIDIGTAYISILEKSILSGIRNPRTRLYAVIVSYANGPGALLRSFSSRPRRAIKMINALTPAKFYRHIERHHPAAQAFRYLRKVMAVYQTLS